MTPADSPVVQLPAKDAIALLRLLEGFETLLREGTVQDDDQVLAAGGVNLEAVGQGPWRERLAAEARAACGLLRQSLEGYDPSSTLSPARPSQGAPSTRQA